MQNVWSRIAQTRLSCQCPSCLTTASGVARRATAATGKRTSRYAYSSTLFYSGIFAAAATTDAGIKQRRREQWDRAIADVKQDLAQDEVAAPPNEAKVVEEAGMRAYDGANITGQEKEDTTWQNVDEDEAEAIFESEYAPTTSPPWPANTGAKLVPHNLPPQSKYAPDHAKQRALKRRWTPKKIRVTELAVDKLVLRLLLYMDDKDCRVYAARAVPKSFQELLTCPRGRIESLLEETQHQLEAVRKADAWLQDQALPKRLPHGNQYHQDDEGYFHSTAADLNSSLKALFAQRAADGLPYSHMLAKLCYNLSISSAPPNLQCWNTLLSGFMRLGRNDHPIFVTIRAIRESNVRMNEDTMISLLNYYTSINHSHRFIWFVGLMRGLENGLALARPDITINEIGASRLVRIDDPVTGTTKIIQKPHHTPALFEALVKGVLHFAGFDAALRVCQDMGREGWGLSMRGLTPLLRDCVARRDWESGQDIWTQIKLIQGKSRREGNPERIHFQTYVEGLKLFAFSKQEDLFHDTFNEALKARHSQRMLLEALRASPQQQSKEEAVTEQISQEQLEGSLEGTVELAEYEAVERPMEIAGGS